MDKGKTRQKGFTLIEMIVAMVVLGIMLATSVSGLMAWQDWSDFNRVNEYAETMFLAAQNQLAEYSANGTLSDFSARAYAAGEEKNVINLDEIYYEEGKTYTAEKLKENSVWTSKENGTLCYITANKGDYALYMDGVGTTSPTAPLVFELLSSYIYDQSLLNETISIEFSLEDGQVFAAFYTDKSAAKGESRYEEFEYDNRNDNLRGLVNIAKRFETYRRERMVGYYGVDTLSLALTNKKDKPTIANISLNNEDTLNLSFKIGKYPNAISQLSYEINVYDDDTKNLILSLTLDGTKVKNYLNREAVPCPVTRYLYDDAGNLIASEALGEYDIVAYLDKNNKLRVLFDAADIQATTFLYEEELALLDDAARIANGEVRFAGTYSFHRFGVDADNIYCTVMGYGAQYKATSTRRSNASNAYFASENHNTETVSAQNGSKNVKNYNYSIENARHLYNVRYLEDLTEEHLRASNVNYMDADELHFHYALESDVDWEQFVLGENYYNSGVQNLSATAAADGISNMYFASVNTFRQYDTFEGRDKTISGLVIKESHNSVSGIYEKNEKNSNGDIIEKPVGLFAENYGTIQNVKLDKIQVTSNSDKVGAFCGVNVCGCLADGTEIGVLYNLQVLNTDINADKASVIKGKEHVGGVVGFLSGVEDKSASGATASVKLEKLDNAAKVTGNKYVGGILGEVRVPRKHRVAIEIADCTNTGAVIGRTDNLPADRKQTDVRFVGGITGYCANLYEDDNGEKDHQLLKLTDCKSAPEYSTLDLESLLDSSVENATATLASKLNGVYVGGISGFNFYSTISRCSTETPLNKQSYVFGNQYVGGIVGFNCGPASGIKGGNNTDRGINSANVVGREYVGGITGTNADIDREQLFADARNSSFTKEAQDDAELINKLNAIIRSDPKTATPTEVQLVLEYTDIIAVPKTTPNPGVQLEQWVNKGIVFATDSYAGGISGYNTGWIYNCDSKVRNTKTAGFFQSTYSGDFAGGIAGYNNGIIGNTKRNADNNYKVDDSRTASQRRIAAICYVTGTNYVGGIVGYNDENAIVEDYAIAGGSIRGNDDSYFVGGYAGFNSSILLLQDEEGNARYIESNPNEVKGRYCIGGSIGANIVNTNGYGDGLQIPVDPNCYAQIVQKDGFYFENGKRTTTVDLRIYNNLDVPVSNWYVVVGDIGVSGAWNCRYEDGKIVRSCDSSFHNPLAKGNTGGDFGFKLHADTDEELKKILNMKFPVIYDGLDTSAFGRYAADKPCPVVFSKERSWSDWGQSGVNYHYITRFSNLSDSACSSWQIVVWVPDGTTVSQSYSCESRIEGNYLYINNLSYNGTMSAGQEFIYNNYPAGQLYFASETAVQEFEKNFGKARVSYDGKVFFDNLEGGGTSPSEDSTTPASGSDITVQFKTDNFLGQLKGKAYVGGFVGYNMLVDSSNAGYENGYVYEVQNKLMEKLEANKNSVKSQYLMLEDFEDSEKIKLSTCTLHIEGDKAVKKTNSLGIITGDICVGGVVGYNAVSTKLYISDVVNATPIKAATAIANPDEQKYGQEPARTKDYRGNDMSYTYSYVGGIIGKVSLNTTIDNCQNSATGIVNSKGIYNGGLCEVNEGTILNCKVAVTGSGVTEYVAGICGLNKPTGVVKNCVAQNVTVSGKNMVGGIAAENFGTIESPLVQTTKMSVIGKTVQVGEGTNFDGVCGGVAAYNAPEGVIVLSEKQAVKTSGIDSKGDYAGLIVGLNYGTIRSDVKDANGNPDYVEITGSVTARRCAGGVIGQNNSAAANGDAGTIDHYINRAVVTTTLGTAGGIVGDNASDFDIDNCINYGKISASESGNAGGIVAENSGVISNCTDYGEILTPNGMCGGIAALNKKGAVIKNCQVQPVDEQGELEFSALENVGGVCAINDGEISTANVKNLFVRNFIKSGVSNIGAVVGVNNGSIALAPYRNAVVNCKVQTYTQNSNLGGVAGLNRGSISGKGMDGQNPEKPLTILECSIGFCSLSSATDSSATIANMGGVAGTNEGTIKECSVDGTITGNLGSPQSGYGGIAGISGNASEGALISHCSFDGTLAVKGSSDSGATTGGIVGRNFADSTVDHCWIGILDSAAETTISSGNTANTSANPDKTAYANIGGLVGENSGKILACDNYKYSTDRVSIINFAGSSGGITGKNLDGGLVTGFEDDILSTGANWKVDIRYIENDNGNGGIIGKNDSGEDISYVKNYAEVNNSFKQDAQNNCTIGGIIGRCENKYGTLMRMYKCENYGYIYSQKSSGGIISTVKWQGVIMDSCVNYGEVVAYETAGGMIGKKNQCPYTVKFVNCENHGKISANKNMCGGILGKSNETGTTFVFYNCVNTGEISSGHGISYGDNGNDKITLVNCRNYGTKSGGGYGMLAKNAGTRNMFNCLDVRKANANSTTNVLAYNTLSNGANNFYIQPNSKNYSTGEVSTDNRGVKLSVTARDGQFVIKPSWATNEIVVEKDPTASSYSFYGKNGDYQEIDSKYLNFLYAYTAVEKKPAKPGGFGLTQINCNNRLTWNFVKDNSVVDYELSYELVDSNGDLALNPDGSPVLQVSSVFTGVNFYDFEMKNEWREAGYKLHAKVRAVNGYHLKEGGSDVYDSDWAEVTSTLKSVLPIPQIHVELAGPTDYIAVLDNREDYKVGDEYLDCKVEVTSSDTGKMPLMTIQVAQGIYSTTVKNYNICLKDGNKFSYATAKPNDSLKSTYVESSQSQAQLCVIGTKNFQEKSHTVAYAENFDGFHGATSDSLTYQIDFYDVNKGKNGEGSAYIASDLIAYDEELGMDISYSHGNTYISFAGATSSVLSHLPADLIGKENIDVYTYPWYSNHYLIHYGRTVMENVHLMKFEGADSELSEKEIDGVCYYNPRKLVDDKYLVKSGSTYVPSENLIWDDAEGKLKKGYVVSKNEDDTYTVYYNSCLAFQTSDGMYCVDRNHYTKSGAVNADGYEYYTNTATTGATGKQFIMQPSPVIDTENIEIETDSLTGATTYSFRWDVDANTSDKKYKNAVYNAELFGISIDGTKVSLALEKDLSARQVSFVDSHSNWNYPIYEIQITRVGEIEVGTEKTTILPQRSVEQIAVKLRLSAITMPSVELNQVNGFYDKDHLNYRVTWAAISDQKEIEDLGGYLIEAKSEGANAQTHYYYIEEVTNPSGPSDGIGLDLDALSAEGTVEKLTYVVDDGADADAFRSAVIDLAYFNSGDSVLVSVRAIARKDAVYFKDGLSQDAYIVEIPTRLEPKSADLLKMTPVYDEENPITETELNDKGLSLSVSDPASEGITGQYELAIAIYDENGKELQQISDVSKIGGLKQISKLGDMVNEESGYWNSGAIKTISYKANAIEMQGSDISSALYQLVSTSDYKLSEYAGMWMKIAIRCVADDKITSYWSDEDPYREGVDAGTVNYVWYQIPKMKLDTPKLSISSLYQYYDGTKYSAESLAGMVYFNSTNRILVVDAVDHCDGYAIQMLDDTGSCHMVYVDVEKDEYRVYYAGANMGVLTATGSCRQNPAARYVGKLEKDNDVAVLPYTRTVWTNGEVFGQDVAYEVPAQLRLADGKLQIVLPDVISIGSGEGSQKLTEAYDFTKLVAVKGVIDPSKDARYLDSDINSYKRRVDAQNDRFEDIGVMSQSTVELSDISLGATANEINFDGETRTAISYTVSVGNASPCDSVLVELWAYDAELKAYDAELKAVCIDYRQVKLTASGDKLTGSFELFEDDWFKQGGKAVICFTPVTEQGLGVASPDYYLLPTGLGERIP